MQLLRPGFEKIAQGIGAASLDTKSMQSFTTVG